MVYIYIIMFGLRSVTIWPTTIAVDITWRLFWHALDSPAEPSQCPNTSLHKHVDFLKLVSGWKQDTDPCEFKQEEETYNSVGFFLPKSSGSKAVRMGRMHWVSEVHQTRIVHELWLYWKETAEKPSSNYPVTTLPPKSHQMCRPWNLMRCDCGPKLSFQAVLTVEGTTIQFSIKFVTELDSRFFEGNHSE